MKTRNEESIPHECFCPITQEIMEDPVMAHDGHTYERTAIKEWFDRGHRNSPKTGARVLSIELTPNHAMRSLIEDLKANLSVLARHKLNEKSIEAVIRLREEEMQLKLEEKGNLLNAEQEKRSELEKELEIMRNRTAQPSLQPLREKEPPAGELTILLQLLQALQMQKQTELMEKMQKQQKQIEQLEMKPVTKPLEQIFDSETLFEAAKRGHLATVKWLLGRGASISDKDNDGVTALHYAAHEGDTATVECLLRHGASTSDKTTNEGATALHYAAHEGHTATVECLLGHGASISDKDNDGWTALHIAAHEGDTETVECLLRHGASTSDKTTNEGATALHIAAQKDHTATVECLLGHGASIRDKTNDGFTALAFAIKPEMIKLLKNYQSPIQLPTNSSRFINNQSPKPQPGPQQPSKPQPKKW